jgi:hypothetical protein
MNHGDIELDLPQMLVYGRPKLSLLEKGVQTTLETLLYTLKQGKSLFP